MPVSISGDGAISGLQLESFEDVDVGSGADDGQFLSYDATGGVWIPRQGGLVAVKSALFTGTQAASVAAGSNVAVTDLSITHEVADAGNKLIISAYFGAAGTTGREGRVGIAIHDGSGLINIGQAAGNRVSVTAGGIINIDATTVIVTMPHISFVHTPGAGSKTYTVRAINIDSGTETLYINRSESDADTQFFTRATSGLVIQEVSV